MAKKKVTTSGLEEKRAMIEPEHQEIAVRRQCEIIGLSRASYYYKPGLDAEEEHNRLLMRLIDE